MSSRSQRALDVIRIVTSGTMLVHGLYRLLAGGVVPFGGALDSWGFPAGVAIAWAITIGEIVGGVTLLSRRYVRPLSVYFAAELMLGIVFVHGREGWFVVGGGRNGVEYSVLLIVLFLTSAWAHDGKVSA